MLMGCVTREEAGKGRQLAVKFLALSCLLGEGMARPGSHAHQMVRTVGVISRTAATGEAIRLIVH